MIVQRASPTDGVCFAWWPRRTPDGLVWFEVVGYEWIEGWGWGSAGHWKYSRLKYRTNKQPAVSWSEEQARLHANPPDHYTTPPEKSKCRNYGRCEPGEAVPCWHPHCTCMSRK